MIAGRSITTNYRCWLVLRGMMDFYIHTSSLYHSFFYFKFLIPLEVWRRHDVLYVPRLRIMSSLFSVAFSFFTRLSCAGYIYRLGYSALFFAPFYSSLSISPCWATSRSKSFALDFSLFCPTPFILHPFLVFKDFS